MIFLKAVIINGSNSISSRLTGVEQEIESLLTKNKVTFDKIIVHQLPAEDLLTANYKSPTIIENVNKVAEADIVVLLTPVYKGAYSGILKTFLDLLPQKGLENKTVVPIAIGGSIAHLLSIDYALKPVVSILGATHITSPLYVIDKLVTRVDDSFSVDHEIKERLNNVWQQVITLETTRV